ncbi:hypothetical protein O181_005159 [Austropuccinia psidii MF-1]|uniref:Mediator of RNA polymerase II transcription subunit 1 n=1 Tax=Austropuccinia psidii MF-1 TaxID=1389203 RepID=A0A9Q3GFL8_9BASI|nr:hypothetical protein [Austropuccinia psidii MF-1]
MNQQPTQTQTQTQTQTILNTLDDLINSFHLAIIKPIQLNSPFQSTPIRNLNLQLQPQSSLHPSLIHPLFLPYHSVASSKKIILKSLNSISNSLKNFNLLTSNLKSKSDQQQDNQLVKLFALLRESSTHLNSIIHSNHLIQVSSKSISSATSSNLSKSHAPSTFLSPSYLLSNNHQTQKSSPSSLLLIESVAREIGLECFRESQDSILLMIAGKLMVIDIEIEPNDLGRIRRCKFSYTFAEEEAKRDEFVDDQLCLLLSDVHHSFYDPILSLYDLNQLKLVQGSLDRFAKCLRQLKELDELIDHQKSNPASSSIDYFFVLRNLITNYHHHYKKTINPSTSQLNHVPLYGIPITSPTQYQLNLIYHYFVTEYLRGAIQNQPTHASTIMIGLTAQAEHNPHYSLQLTTQPSQSQIFTAHFLPPLCVSRVTASNLFEISTGQPHEYHHPSFNNPGYLNHVKIETEDEVFLEDLLVDESMTPNSSARGKWLQNKSWKFKRFGKKFQGQSRQVYNFLKEETGQGSKDGLGYLVTRVPFESLDSLLKIIQICQRQSILNELFQSCFNPNCYLFDHPHDPHGLSTQPIDPFIGIQHSPQSNFEVGVAQSKLTTHEFLQDLTSDDLSIDIILRHFDYSMMIQFVLTTNCQLVSHDDVDLISLIVKVEEDSSIKLQVANDIGEEEDIRMLDSDCLTTNSANTIKKIKRKAKKLEKIIEMTRNIPTLIRSVLKVENPNSL